MIANYIIRKIIKRSNCILDVGCGKGVWEADTNYCFGKKFTGIDLLENYPAGYTKYIQHNLERGLPRLKEKYDFVIAKDILEHLHTPLELLKEIHALTIQDGILVVKVPDYRSKNAWGDYTHIRPYTKGAIIQIVEDAGFEVQKVVRLGGYFLPNLFTQAFSWLVVARR